jgi:hypothetical protein
MICKIISENDMNCFTLTSQTDGLEESILLIGNNDIDDLIQFKKMNNISNLFYAESYLVRIFL